MNLKTETVTLIALVLFVLFTLCMRLLPNKKPQEFTLEQAAILSFENLSNFKNVQEMQGCNGEMYGLLDYWIGDWIVYENETVVGTNKIEKIVDGCGVLENWKNSKGQPGVSFFYIDNDSKTWEQIWVTGESNKPWGQKEKSLIYFKKDSLLIFQGSYLIDGKNYLDRTLLLKHSNEIVKQRIQISKDGGTNWKTTFDAIYKRIKSEP